MIPDVHGRYREHFSENGFWRKVSGLPGRIGRDVVLMALTLYALLEDLETPLWAKALAAAALGYLICPVDAVPDCVPFVGYSDDAAAMALLLRQLGAHVTPRIARRAEELMPERFRA